MFATIDEILLGRATTDLDTLRAAGDLQERYDTKYVLTVGVTVELLQALDPHWQVLEVDRKRSTAYQSSYYDDSDFGLFHDHVKGRRLRYKVRTRRYGNDPEEMLEVKLKTGRGGTDKRRVQRAVAFGTELTNTERQWLSDTVLDAYGRRPATALKYTLGLNYERRTMFNPMSGDRLTIDSGVIAQADSGTASPVGNAVVIEVKSAAWCCPTVRLLHRHSIRPLNFSKYCAAASALHPELDRRARLRAERSFAHYQT
ncbi:MAG: polyphosphate polymerase domain-containing protein [Actinomycetia bacterium]|nr:polyphosphate polymerase domain-containing protein [Actinomycetes bacterium]